MRIHGLEGTHVQPQELVIYIYISHYIYIYIHMYMYLYMYALHFVYICIHGYVYARIFTVSNYPLLSSLPATESSPILTIHERSSWVFPKFQNLAWLIIILDDIKIYSQSFRTLVGFRFGLAPANRW